MVQLYPHQQDMVYAVADAFGEGTRKAVAVIATGGGKTLGATATAAALCPPDSGKRVLWICHQRELAGQAYRAFQQFYAPLQIGRIMTGYQEYRRPVTIALIQSLARIQHQTALQHWGLFDLIIIDEAHHAVARGYQRALDTLLAPQGYVLGITATPARADQISLHQVFDRIVYYKGMLDLMVTQNPQTGRPFLADLLPPITIETDVSLKDAPLTNGEIRPAVLDQALATSKNRFGLAFAAYRQYCQAQNRPTLIFTGSKRDALAMEEFFQARHVKVASIFGTTPSATRMQILGDPVTGQSGDFERGNIDALIGVDVFREGVDMPWVSAGIDGRIPQSPWTLQQMVGRVVRDYPGKEDARWISLAPCDHTLMTPSSFLGLDRPLTVSVRHYLQDQADAAKVTTDRRIDQLIYAEEPGLVQGTTRNGFALVRSVGTWHRDPFSQNLRLDAECGTYHLQAFGTAYQVSYMSQGGRTTRLIQEPISGHLAIAYAEQHAHQQRIRREQRNLPEILAGPVTAETLMLAKKMRLRNVSPTMSEAKARAIIAAVKPHLKKPTRSQQVVGVEKG